MVGQCLLVFCSMWKVCGSIAFQRSLHVCKFDHLGIINRTWCSLHRLLYWWPCSVRYQDCEGFYVCRGSWAMHRRLRGYSQPVSEITYSLGKTMTESDTTKWWRRVISTRYLSCDKYWIFTDGIPSTFNSIDLKLAVTCSNVSIFHGIFIADW